MRPIAKFIVLGGSLIIASIGAAAIMASHKEKAIESCEDTKSESTAPGGAYTAELVVHTCAWGFGQAAESVDLKVTKLGTSGWFMHVPIEYDSTAEDRGTSKPTTEWAGPGALVVNVTSNSRTGTIVSSQLGLTITRTYRAAP
jgi:hypothetical protein